MKVKQLVKLLLTVDQDLEIVVPCDENGDFPYCDNALSIVTIIKGYIAPLDKDNHCEGSYYWYATIEEVEGDKAYDKTYTSKIKQYTKAIGIL